MSSVELERASLAVGDLLAEGGEGRVHELAQRPDTLFKSYKVPVPAGALRALVSWADELNGTRPARAARLRASSAWPTAVVVDPRSDLAAGLLVPRAPARFWLSHRDGKARLASLSYLTSDPKQRAAAYGLALPPPMAPERLGLAYALARLLAAFEGDDTSPSRSTPGAAAGEAQPRQSEVMVHASVAHGDLSAKNVLWSLDRGPEIYVIDCDNAELYSDGVASGAGDRRRAMTPNWDDPSIPAGGNPGRYSDRYSMALIFLRIVGAAHFPIQARQRKGEPVSIDFEVPSAARRLPSLDRSAPIWRVVAGGLSVAEPEKRPTAACWAGVLEEVLTDLGEGSIVRQVWSLQEGLGVARPSPPPDLDGFAGFPGDVRIRPVSPTPRIQAWRIVTAEPAEEVSQLVEPALVVVRRYARYAVVWWWLSHQRMARSLATSGRRRAGLRRLVFLLLTDFVIGCIGLFLFAMIVSPFFGL